MSLWAWLDLEGSDIAVFTVAGLLGFLLGRILPPGPIALYTSILLPYHIFLGWLVLKSEESGLSMSIFSTIVFHLAFMAVVIVLAFVRHLIPFFGIVRYLLALLAIFECRWLFRADTVRPVKVEEPEVVTPAVKIQFTSEDEEAWLHYLAQKKPGSRRTNASLRSEYEQWMLARMANRTATAANKGEPVGQ